VFLRLISRRKKEEGRRKKEEGRRRKKEECLYSELLNHIYIFRLIRWTYFFG
jgi:hypothetical protein